MSFLTLVAYGAVWTRGVQGDDLCICELASTYDFSIAVQRWLDQWNGRLFHSVVQIGTYGLPWFADPFRAPWYLLHGGSVLAHTLFCCLLLHLLLRAGIGRGAALVSTTAFAVHPITAEPVLWLAESSGYVLGNLLLLLAIWAFLQHERRPGAPWAVLTVLLAVCATLTIEQYLPALCLLALAYWVWSRREGARRTPWLAVAAVFFCVLAFAVFHFGGFSGTADRLSRVHDQPPAAGEQRPSLLWTFAWWLVLAPDMGLFSGALVSGWRILLNDWRVMAAVGVAVIAATAMIASRSTWTAPRTVPARSYRFWLIIAGLLAFTGSLLPFLVTGRYGIAVRNMYVALPGLLVVCAVGLDLLTTRASLRRWAPIALVPAMGGLVALSLAANVGMQALFARSWELHRAIIQELQRDAEAIRVAGAVEVTGIPISPYRGISMLDYGWAFPCLARWVVGSNDVKAWNNLMPTDRRLVASNRAHRIHILPAGK